MREPIKGLYPGCKLKPVCDGGYAGWYPYITFVESTSERDSTIILSNGDSIDNFSLKGWMEFVVVDDCLENK